MQVGDIDFQRRILTVSRQVQRAGGDEVEIRLPKCESEGDIFPAPGLVDMLAAHIAAHGPGDNPERWLFAAEGQPPLHQTRSVTGGAER